MSVVQFSTNTSHVVCDYSLSRSGIGPISNGYQLILVSFSKVSIIIITTSIPYSLQLLMLVQKSWYLHSPANYTQKYKTQWNTMSGTLADWMWAFIGLAQAATELVATFRDHSVTGKTSL